LQEAQKIKRQRILCRIKENQVRYYKVVRIDARPAFNFSKDSKGCLSYLIIGQRLEPIDCPKDLISQYGTDSLPIIT